MLDVQQLTVGDLLHIVEKYNISPDTLLTSADSSEDGYKEEGVYGVSFHKDEESRFTLFLDNLFIATSETEQEWMHDNDVAFITSDNL